MNLDLIQQVCISNSLAKNVDYLLFPYNVGAISYFNGYFGYGTGPSLQVLALCTGNETSLFRCRRNDANTNFLSFQTCYDHSYDLGVQCKGILYSCNKSIQEI